MSRTAAFEEAGDARTPRAADRALLGNKSGASPAQAARTARMQRAKRLLDGTDLPMAEVALCAGFGSLRRFNAVFVEVCRRPPTAIRRRAEGGAGRAM